MGDRAWPDEVERVAAFLRAAGVEARVEEFRAGTPTAEDAARAVGCELGQIVKSLVFECDGQALVEYSLLLALIAVVAFGAVNEFGLGVSSLYSQIVSGVKAGMP